jgi:hypothetical protein
MFSKFEFRWNLVVVYQAYINPISVSGNLGQGLGVAFNNRGGSFGLYSQTTSFPANCERAHVQFAGVYSVPLDLHVLSSKVKKYTLSVCFKSN